MWRACRFLGALLRALEGLPGGLGRFLLCRIGAHHCRLLDGNRVVMVAPPYFLELSHAGFLDHFVGLIRVS